MKRYISVMAIALMFLFLTSIISIASDQISEELQKSIDFRMQLGLEQDPAEIGVINSESKNHVSIDRFGIALTNEEYNELIQRKTVLNEARKIRKEVIDEKYSKIFSDLFFDHDKGVIKIGIVNLRNNLDKANEIYNYFANKERVEFFNTKVNIKELKEIQLKISNYAKKNSTPIRYTEISIKDNNVVVGVTDTNEKLINNLYAISPYIELIKSSIIEYDDSRTGYTRPLEAGLSLGTCTGAFSAKKWGSPDNYYYLTAAHCGNLNSSWSQGGSSIGTLELRNYGGNSDVAGIEIDSNHIGYKLYDSCNSCDPVRNNEIASVQVNTNDDIVGDFVCMSGKTSGWPVCGLIESTTYSPTNWANTGVDFTNLRRATYRSDNGDSGAPIVNLGDESLEVYEFEAQGINKGHVTIDGNEYGVFTHIGYVYDDLGVNQIITNNY